MRVARAGLEAGAHARRQLRLPVVGAQRRMALENVDEFVLPALAVAKGRDGIRGETGQGDAEIAHAKGIAELPLFPTMHAGSEWLGIIGRACHAERPYPLGSQ